MINLNVKSSRIDNGESPKHKLLAEFLVTWYYVYSSIAAILLYLTFDQPNMLFQGDALEGSDTYSNGSYGKKSRRRALVTIWDKVKSHATVIDWCAGREWPVNCMTVISAWWQSNVPFLRCWVGDWTII